MEEIIGLDISEMGVEEPKEFRMMEAEFSKQLTLLRKESSQGITSGFHGSLQQVLAGAQEHIKLEKH